MKIYTYIHCVKSIMKTGEGGSEGGGEGEGGVCIVLVRFTEPISRYIKAIHG